MKKTIRIVALVAALLAGGSAYADDINAVYVRTSTGDVAVALSELTEVTFPADGQMKVTTTTSSTTYSLAEGLISLRFDQNHSGVELALDKELSGLVLKGRVLYSSEEGIEVYSLDGVLCKAGSGNQLDLSELVKGVYVARSGSLTSKIMLR